MEFARLGRYGLLAVTGEQAREFLHAQLTNDIASLPAGRAALAGWCSAKGRLLASFLVVPVQGGFLLQLARDLAPTVAKRLSMFVLRSRVKISDVTEAWRQYGVWGEPSGAPNAPFGAAAGEDQVVVAVDTGRFLVLSRNDWTEGGEVPESRWALDEIRAGRPLITSATQDLFVPQMVNFDTIGAVNFQKGCYPGQEIVARTHFLGQAKRGLALLHADAPVAAGTPVEADERAIGSVVSARDRTLLAVVPADATPAALQANGIALAPSPLLGGLAR